VLCAFALGLVPNTSNAEDEHSAAQTPEAARKREAARRSRRAQIIAGLSVFGAAYTAPMVIGMLTVGGESAGGGLNLLPVAGPIAYGALTAADDSSTHRMLAGALIFCGVVQASGLVLATVAASRGGNTSWIFVTPSVNDNGASISAFGRF
jgi:hypothetical protein